ncbi:MAG: ShlB/FhaC/HecB family hemolysin secretion/activation protein [Enterobacteriaceae bacterium]|jgi:hemolysin activation/secretion protein|nr:ShlB/FhaC/HecB family hemolysin secretion/activation protein [Enterobacteriaceae bacterium]
MKSIQGFLLTSLIFSYPLSVSAQVDFDRLVKEQQNNDSNSRQENKIEKKDVYSSVEKTSVIDNTNIPEEKQCIKINELVIGNNFLRSTEIKKMQQDMVGSCLGVQGIGQLAANLQDYIINLGYATTRVETPDQDLSLGRLVLMIKPGRIENVIIENNDVKSWILPFGKEDILNIRNIEQGLENLQKVSGVDIKINIEPGSQNGYSNIVINTNRTKRWDARLSFNNWGDESTGRNIVGGTGYLYNLAKMSDIFYLSGSTSTTSDYTNISTYYSVPFGFWDYELFYSNSRSRQGVNISSMDLDYVGKSEYLSLKASRTLYRDKDKKITGFTEIFRRKSGYKLDGIELKLQKRDMGNIRFGVNYKQNFVGSALDAALSYQRFVTWFGGTETPDMKSGDVKPASHIVNLDTNYIKLLDLKPFNAYYNLRLGGQYSLSELTLQDQFTLGSRWNVRGFENSTGIYGDKGFYIQNTVSFMTGFKDAELYFGADYGQVAKSNYSQTKYNSKKLMGVVTGVKGSFSTLGYDFSLSAPLLYPDELDTDSLNVNFNLFYQF